MEKKYKERLKLWVKALRSGKYKQGRLSLRTSQIKAYCCLGVACAVFKKETKKGKWKDDRFVIEDGTNIDVGSDSLPNSVINFFGLLDSDPGLLLGNGLEATAVTCNDDLRLDFKEIADAIERTYELTKQRKPAKVSSSPKKRKVQTNK